MIRGIRLWPETLVLALLLTGLAGGRSRAEDDGAPAKGPTVAIFFLDSPDVSDAVISTAARSLEHALHKNPHLNVKDSGQLLAEYSGEIPKADIDAARTNLSDGDNAMAERKYKEAEKKYRAAVVTFEQLMPYIHKQDLADAMEGMGGALAAQGQRGAAVGELESLLVWRPEQQYDASRHGSAGQSLFTEAQATVGRLGTGSLRVTSDPPGAEAFIDGRFVGVSPVEATGLTEGDHYVTFKKAGFNKAIVKGHVDPRHLETAAAPLVRNEKYAALQEKLDEAAPTLGNPEADGSLLDLRTTLFIDQVVVVAVSDKSGAIQLDGYLYDLRSKQRLAHVTKVAATDADLPKTTAALGNDLYTGVSYDLAGSTVAGMPPGGGGIKFSSGGGGDDQAASGETDARDTGPPPILKKWWFWAGVGVVVAGGVTAAYLLTHQPQGAPCQAGASCAQITW